MNAEHAGSVYASLVLRVDELEKGIVKAQAKIDGFAKKTKEETKGISASIGKGFKSGFDIAGKGAVQFGKTLAMSLGPVYLAITLVTSALSAIKSLFGDAAKDTASFGDAIADISRYFKDKLLPPVKALVGAFTWLLEGVAKAFTGMTKEERTAARESENIEKGRAELLKKRAEQLDLIALKEKSGAITAIEAAKARYEAQKQLVDGLSELIATNKNASDEAKSGLDDEIKKMNALKISTGEASNASTKRADTLKTLRQAIAAINDLEQRGAITALEAEKQRAQAHGNALNDLEKIRTEYGLKKGAVVDSLNKEIALQKEATAKADKRAKAEGIITEWQKKLNETQEKTNTLLSQQVINDNKNLTEKEKKLALVEAERQKELEKVDLQFKETEMTQANIDLRNKLTDAINQNYDAVHNGIKTGKEEISGWQKVLKEVSDYAQVGADMMTTIMNTMIETTRENIQEQIDLIDELLAKDKERIEEQRQRALEEAGFVEMARSEDMQAQIDAAIKAGDEVLQYQLQRRQQEMAINEEFNAKNKAAEEKAAKEKATLEYKLAKEEYAIKIITAIQDTAMAITKALSSGVPPLNFVLAAATGAAAAVQMGVLLSNPPKAPKFAMGGIVPGNKYSGDQVPALVNSGELILNKAQQDNLAGGIMGGGKTQATIIIQLDTEDIGRAVFDLANNGLYSLKTRAVS